MFVAYFSHLTFFWFHTWWFFKGRQGATRKKTKGRQGTRAKFGQIRVSPLSQHNLFGFICNTNYLLAFPLSTLREILTLYCGAWNYEKNRCCWNGIRNSNVLAFWLLSCCCVILGFLTGWTGDIGFGSGGRLKIISKRHRDASLINNFFRPEAQTDAPDAPNSLEKHRVRQGASPAEKVRCVRCVNWQKKGDAPDAPN